LFAIAAVLLVAGRLALIRGGQAALGRGTGLAANPGHVEDLAL
jgi:hypothetical protein